MNKILITGGAGFIGFHLAQRLKEQFKIDLIDDFSRGNKDAELNSLIDDINVKIHKINLLKDHKKIDKLSKNYSYIFHLAAIVGVKNVMGSPYEVLTKNINLLQNTINIAKKQKKLKRFVFASSSEVYYGTLENHGLTFPTNEKTKISLLNLSNKRGTYMLSKIYGEALCRQSGLPFTIIRPHNFYGPRMGLSHVIPELCKKIYFSKNKKIKVFSPQHRRNFCYIDDGVKLILSLIFKKQSLRKTFNVGSNTKDITIEKLAKNLIRTSKKKLKNKKEKNLLDSPIRRFPDVSKALKIAQIKYNYPLTSGLSKTYEWYKKNLQKK